MKGATSHCSRTRSRTAKRANALACRQAGQRKYAGKQFSGLFAQMLPSLTKSIFAGLAPHNTATLFPYTKTADLLLPQLKLLPVSLTDCIVQQMGKNIVGVIEKQGMFSSLAALVEQQRRPYVALHFVQLKTWRILFTDYRRPLETFTSSFRTAIGLYFFKESYV